MEGKQYLFPGSGISLDQASSSLRLDKLQHAWRVINIFYSLPDTSPGNIETKQATSRLAWTGTNSTSYQAQARHLIFSGTDPREPSKLALNDLPQLAHALSILCLDTFLNC